MPALFRREADMIIKAEVKPVGHAPSAQWQEKFQSQAIASLSGTPVSFMRDDAVGSQSR